MIKREDLLTAVKTLAADRTVITFMNGDSIPVETMQAIYQAAIRELSQTLPTVRGYIRTCSGREYTGIVNNIEAATVEEYANLLSEEMKLFPKEFKVQGPAGLIYVKAEEMEAIGVTTLQPKKRPLAVFR